MIDFWRLFLQSLLVLVFVTFITWTVISLFEAKDAVIPAAYGIGIAYLNALIGYALLYWGFRRSDKLLMLAVFGGMIFRLFLILLFLFILIGALKVDEVPLVSTLIAAYFLFLGLEVFHVYKSMVNKRVEL